MPYKNKADRRESWRRWRARNKDRDNKRIRARQQHIQEWLRTSKATLTCICCPECHPACLEFHHRDPKQKDIDVSRAARNGWSIERIKKEIAKCDVMCSNCHRKLHASSFNGRTAPSEGVYVG
jgi:hypothetical protein